MIRIAIFILSLLAATQASASEYIRYAIPNQGTGVCWWASAESIMLTRGWREGQGLCAEVIKSGVGYKNGASMGDVDHYVKLGWFTHTTISKYQVYEYLEKKEAVIATVKPWTTYYQDGSSQTGCHAIVVVDMVRKPVLGWRVIYWDCNNPYTFNEMSWVDFARINTICSAIGRGDKR